MRRVFALVAIALVAACVGTTGGDLVSFDAAAAGPADAVRGQPLAFDTGRGWHVTLTHAQLHVGAVYLNRSIPTSAAQQTSCVLPGIYVGQVLEGIDVDLLSPDPQAFGGRGAGVADRAVAGEVWLTGGDVNAPDDPTTILDVVGTAAQGTQTIPFHGRVTIGKNRATGSTDPSQPGLNPPCKLRIVSPIPIDVPLANGGSLLLRVDPRAIFANVDFGQLAPPSSQGATYEFDDAMDSQPSINLFKGMHAAEGVYVFEWRAR